MTHTLHRLERLPANGSCAQYQFVARERFDTAVVHAPRRRIRAVTGLVVLLALLATLVAVRVLTEDSRRNYLAADGWPARGQAAYQLGAATPRASADQRPVPIASLAKVMTAYLVITEYPLRRGASGPSLRVTRADVADTARRRAADESVVHVAVGERLSERQALMAMLLASANNVAWMVTRLAGGPEVDFVRRMNSQARRLGMTHTTYTDPSGFDDRTVSTAADQLILARIAAANATLATMMATRSYRVPVAGTIHNTDVLLGHGGFVGMKTGSDGAAGGCFMFRVRRSVDGERIDLIGVVLGQPGRHLVLTGQYSARQLVHSVGSLP